MAAMAEKRLPVGICDYCEGPIPPGDWFTRRGPRLYCSVDCRNTANSRAGNAVRTAKQKARVAAGAWQNPAKLRPPTGEEQAARARKGRLPGRPPAGCYGRDCGTVTWS